MSNTYTDLVKQTFYFPQEGFVTKDGYLHFNDLDLKAIIDKYGTPLKLTYLPKIGTQINKAKTLFEQAIKKHKYEGKYHYCYCTKSSHFRYVLEEVLKNDVHLETSSAYDIDLIRRLYTLKKINKTQTIVCNGFKKEEYVQRILDLKESGFENIIPVIDNGYELNVFKERATSALNIGIRIASEEEPKFEFYTSRLGIGYRNITKFYKKVIQEDPNLKLKMLHFFINSGIKDTAYYWNELNKCLQVYVQLRKICPTLDSLNIGGGFPIKSSLSFEWDYEYMAEGIVETIKKACDEEDLPHPNLFTEFGSFTVGESGIMLYSILNQKQQNDRELWYMINNSFMTTLPDVWAIDQRYPMLAINNWDKECQRVFLGGLTCDSEDFYNAEKHNNKIFLPKIGPKDKPLHLGFFYTGAYQESLSGYGGLKHCLIPAPKHIIIKSNKQISRPTQ